MHNKLARDSTKSAVWAQIHLNSFTTASYNVWFKKDDPCPLCRGHIVDEFHLCLECPTVKTLWSLLEQFLRQLTHTTVTQEEMAFGLQGTTPAILLRNWLGYLLRECILQFENIAYHNHLGATNIIQLQHTFNARVQRELCEAYHMYKHSNRLDLFAKYFNPGNSVLVDPNEDVTFENVIRVFNVGSS